MKLPLIGITTAGRNNENQFYCSADYVEAIQRAGGIPILLPPCYQKNSCGLEIIDGLMLTGGSDIEPIHYGGELHETIQEVDPIRDMSEFATARFAIDNKLPTLAICRGAQLVNVVEGGTLHEHVPDVFGEGILHTDANQKAIWHDIYVEPDSRLAEIFGVINFAAPSCHHQCVDKIAKSLVPIAFAKDGVIEALEMPEHPWLMAVQWHPEFSAKEDGLQQKLFDVFVKVASKYQHSK